MSSHRFRVYKSTDPDVIAVHEGRPDFHNPDWGTTRAKRFPPYVYATSGNAALIHKVLHVRLRWWHVADGGQRMVRTNRPMMFGTSVCGQGFFLDGQRATTCVVPRPDAVLCGRCHGTGPTFTKDGRPRRDTPGRQDAHKRLGCILSGE